MKKEEPLFLIVDLFCGFGGTSTGFANAEINGNKICKVIACVNHDPKAIKSHWLNHSEVKHFEEDIRTLDLTELTKIVNYWRGIYPNAYVLLWASLECTNFSKAKGGQARNADSRTLAEHLFRYQEALQPDYIQIENVVEFMAWGPLDEKGKPISKKNGEEWVKWKNQMCAYGYYDEWKELNSADFGAYTSRNRLFGCFAKDGLPIVWPDKTHYKTIAVKSKKAVTQQQNMFNKSLSPWMPVKDVLDFSDEGTSIFNRKKNLSDKTYERIYAGLLKYVAKGDTSFISKYYSGRPAGKVGSTSQPAGTITTAGTQSLIQAQFIAAHYSTGANVTPVTRPCPTISTKDRFQLINPMFFIDKHYRVTQNQSVDQPAGTIMPNDKHRLIEATPFIMPTNFNNLPRSTEEPAPTLTASRRHTYIVNPSHGGHCTSTEAPCPVIVARQDKAPLYVVQCETGPVTIPVYDTDSEVMIRIKKFMVAFNLVDVKMRMLKVLELLKIQGFPETYQMIGNQTDQKKFIGNSVHPLVPKHWAEALGGRLIKLGNRISKAA